MEALRLVPMRLAAVKEHPRATVVHVLNNAAWAMHRVVDTRPQSKAFG